MNVITGALLLIASWFAFSYWKKSSALSGALGLLSIADQQKNGLKNISHRYSLVCLLMAIMASRKCSLDQAVILLKMRQNQFLVIAMEIIKFKPAN